MNPYLPVFQALDAAEVRWLTAGGWAVSLHGVPRMTVDLDLVVDLEGAAGERLLAAFDALGLRPQLPVPARQLLEPERRQHWQQQRGLPAFSWYDPQAPLRIVDLVLALPVPFDDLWRRRVSFRVFGRPVPTLGRKDLIAMKVSAGRPRDLEDVRLLTRAPDSRSRPEGQARGEGLES